MLARAPRPRAMSSRVYQLFAAWALVALACLCSRALDVRLPRPLPAVRASLFLGRDVVSPACSGAASGRGVRSARILARVSILASRRLDPRVASSRSSRRVVSRPRVPPSA